MKKRFLQLILILGLIISLILSTSIVTTAATTSGTCGENLTWILDSKGTLTINGTGEMTNFANYSSAPWFPVRWDVKSIYISDGVTSIGNNAFMSCASTSIYIPDSITTIGEYAFEDSNVESISMSDNVTTIGKGAFSGCSSLLSVKMSNSIQIINEDLFWLCDSLSSVNIPTNTKHIGDYAFERCIKLKSVKIPTGVITIGNYTFTDCTGLESIEIPETETTIGNSAFYGCRNLKDVYYASKFGNWKGISIGSDNSRLTNANLNTIAIISFNANVGNDLMCQKKFWSNEACFPLPIPKRNGYNFLGWYTSEGYKLAETFKTNMDKTLFAHWEEIDSDSKDKVDVVYIINEDETISIDVALTEKLLDSHNIIVARYDNNKFLGVESKDGASKETFLIPTVNKFKVFVWESFNSLRPLLPSKEIIVNY